MAITRVLLSGGTSGKNILVSGTAPGTTIHTAHSSYTDEIYVDACNVSTSDVVVTANFGATTTADQIIQTIPAQVGMVPLITGLQLTGSLVVKISAASGNVIVANGRVNRIST